MSVFKGRNRHNTDMLSGSLWDKILMFALPLAASSMLQQLFNSADVAVVGKFTGKQALAAVGSNGPVINLLVNFFVGISVGTNVVIARYIGSGNEKRANSAAHTAVLVSVICGFVIMALGLLVSPLILNLIGTPDDFIDLAVLYLRIYFCGMPFMMLYNFCSAIFRSKGDTKKPLIYLFVSGIVNVILNLIFVIVFKMGVAGVAIATAMSRVIELIGCVIVSIMSKDIKLDLRYMFIRNKLLFSDFVKLSLPALGNDLSWGVAFSMYSVILGHLGSDAVAANSLVVVVRNIGTVLCFGVASAGGILLGNVMGEGNLEKAKEYASKLLKLTVVAGAVGGLVVLGITPFVLKFASLNETAMHYLKYMLLINTYYIMGAAVNTTLIAGVFRAGGDTKFGLVCDTIDMWCYAVPLGFIAAFVFKLPVLVVYFLLCTDEFVKWPWVLKRYKSGLWAKNITRDHLFEDEEKE